MWHFELNVLSLKCVLTFNLQSIGFVGPCVYVCVCVYLFCVQTLQDSCVDWSK